MPIWRKIIVSNDFAISNSLYLEVIITLPIIYLTFYFKYSK